MFISCRLAGVFLASVAVWFPSAAIAETGYYSVFRSHDSGQTWSRSDTGLPRNSRINAFAAFRDAILAGTDNGLFMSRDHGFNWRPVSGTAAGVGRILSLATTATAIYAGTDRSGILASLDGAVWTVNPAARFRNVRSLLSHAGALYAGTEAQGVFVSRDGGHSWTAMSEGLPSGAQIFSLAALRGEIFAGLYSKGLYAWAANGPWRKLGSVSPLVLAVTGDTLLAGHNPGGIFRSDDSGATWGTSEIALSKDLGRAPVWELGAGPGLALAGVSSGIYRSEERGRRWERVQSGLPNGSSGISFLLGKRFVLAAVFVRTTAPDRSPFALSLDR